MKSILNTLNKFRIVSSILCLGLLFLILGNLYAVGAPSIFDWDPDPVYQGDVVTFSTYESHDSYKWWISDGPGSPCYWETDSADSSESTFTYTFTQNGDWQICLQVPDEEPGQFYTETQTVTVLNHEPEIEDPLWWTATPEPSYVGQAFHVEIPFIDYEESTAYYCTIDYGDGTIAVVGTIQQTEWQDEWLCIAPPHAYATEGNFHVWATIYDDNPIWNSFSTSSIYYHDVLAPVLTLEVNATDDVVDGIGCDIVHCSLREAINDAESGDTITFDTSLSGSTIVLTSQLTLNKNLAIDASELASRVTVNANNKDRVFQVNAGVTATLDSLRITHGNVTGHGGGIYNEGDLVVVNSVLFNNSSSEYGGGIFNFGTLSLEDSSLISNSNNESGGGIYNSGTLSIYNSSLSENSAGVGGAIYNVGSLTIADSSLNQNTATGDGGGIHNIFDGSATVTGCTLSSNSALSGGGIFIDGGGVVTVRDTTFSGNTASYQGGAIFNNTGGEGEVFSSTFINNTAGMLGGGGIKNFGTMTVVNSTFTGNSTGAGVDGGAIYNDLNGTSLELINSTLSGNTGLTTLTNANYATMSYANTIIANTISGMWDCRNNVGTISLNSNNFVRDGTNSNCEAAYSGDPLLESLADNGGPTETMALQETSPAVDVGDDSICEGELVGGVDQRGFERNVGEHCDIGAYEWGAVPPCSDKIKVMNDEDSGSGSLRQAVEYVCPGGEITFDESLSGSTITLAGHIWINKSLTMTGLGADQLAISGGEVEHYSYVNEGDDVGGVFWLHGVYVGGYLQEIEVSMSGLTIKDGRAISGGGIYNHSKSTLTMTDCVIGPNNIVTESGGGLTNRWGEVTLNRCTVMGNHGTGTIGGAGIFTDNGGAITLINSTVTDNVTNNFGGGILVFYGGTVNLIHSTVSGNLANQDYETYAWGGGGGVYVQEGTLGGTLNIHNSIIAGNEDWTDPGVHDPWPDVFGEVTSLGGNLIGDGTGSWGWTGDDLVGDVSTPIDPLLDALALNSPGSTPTFALLSGSPAINAVDCLESVAVDQRGIDRPFGWACDIGAFEFDSIVPDTTPPQVTVPSNLTVQATGPSGAIVVFSASAVDQVDGPLTPTCNPPSGSLFPVGITTVTCTATDAAQNQGQASFTVTVESQKFLIYLPLIRR